MDDNLRGFGGRAVASLGWYAGRAATMSPREMLWRSRRMGAALTGRDRPSEQSDTRMLGGEVVDWPALVQSFRDADGRPVLLDHGRAAEVAAEHPGAVAALIAEADRLLSGERTYFGYPGVVVGAPIDWNYDPHSGYRWPAIPCNKIDHRVASSDPKWIWELNRLQHLPVLAQAWLFTGEAVYADTAFEHLDSWLAQNPVGIGIAWRGAFEAGVRAISVAIAMQGLRNSPGLTAERYRNVVRMLEASARYCWLGRSRFSSANNHLVGELTGLVVVHMLFPELVAPASVFGLAIESLSAEAELQILPDGAGAEQSVCYQMLTAEFLSVVMVLLRLRGDGVPPRMAAALERSSQYLSSIVGVDDPDPRYGDDDDGFALRLGAEPKRTVRQHLGIASAVTSSSHYGVDDTITAAWFGASQGGRGDRAAAVDEDPQAGIHARDGGLVVLRSGRRRLTMDVGPLGHLSIAAHGHADALALTLASEGRDLIVDPGTGSYYGEPAWRDTHRGTRAHATVCVDGLDQSVIGGPFFWSRHATTKVRAVDLVRGIVDAEHDGYRRLDDPVVHRRWLIAPPGDPTVVVVDLVEGQSEHDVTVSWPLHPELEVTPVQDGHLVKREGVGVLQLCYAATTPVYTMQVKADSESHLGWWSDRLESRTPSWSVGARCRAAAPAAVVSLLRTDDAVAIAEPTIVMNGRKLVVSWSEHGVQRGVTIDPVFSGAIVEGPFMRARGAVSTS